MIAYVTMGLRDDPSSPTLGGWFDQYNTLLLEKNGFDYDKAQENAIDDLGKEITNFIQHPTYAWNFFSNKVVSTWLEPTFQSIWSGPLEEMGDLQTNPILKSIYGEGRGYHLVRSLSLLSLTLIFLLSIFAALRLYLREPNLPTFSLYPFLFFLGGFFFHLFWETKSQYVYIYVLLLIPVAAQGLEQLSKDFIHYLKRFLAKV